jgi:hypothetical protein
MSGYICASCGAGDITSEPSGALCADCVAAIERLDALIIRDAARAALVRYERAEDGYIEALATVCRRVATP